MKALEALEKISAGGNSGFCRNGRHEIHMHYGILTLRYDGRESSTFPSALLFDDGWQVVKPETIEVGDEITVQGDHQQLSKVICVVDSVNNGRIAFRPKTTYYTDQENCTIHRKGPKLIEGTEITVTDNGRFVSTGIPCDLPDGRYKSTLERIED